MTKHSTHPAPNGPARCNALQLQCSKPDAIAVQMVSDGTNTVVEIIARDSEYGDVSLGHGATRRRKGEKRRPDLAQAIAYARAFQSAAENYWQHVDRIAGYKVDR